MLTVIWHDGFSHENFALLDPYSHFFLLGNQDKDEVSRSILPNITYPLAVEYSAYDCYYFDRLQEIITVGIGTIEYIVEL